MKRPVLREKLRIKAPRPPKASSAAVSKSMKGNKASGTDGVISVGGIITRGTSLQENLKRVVRKFAKDNHVDNIEKVSQYYSPTPRQRELIAAAAETQGSFEDGWAHCLVSDKFGESTTHWKKLIDRMDQGVGNPCPLLLIGIPVDVVT